ncbi:hypothetical protein EON65_31840 [archaeon]|nr:MAG: hypothetical protein EON65_31840 [archaeon]
MAFFTRLMGGSKRDTAAAASTPASSPGTKSLADYTAEEIFTELQRRGFTVNVNGTVVDISGEESALAPQDTATPAPAPVAESASASAPAPAPTVVESPPAIQEHVFLTLEAIDKWVQQDRHRYDLSRNFDALWLSAWAFDWARQPAGYVCDANKSVKIGLGQYSSHEDPQSSQIVIIRHFDTERPGNYAKRNSCKY